ncbi:hypothetical protein S83_047436, partial [Arachis hypogaea]
NPKRHNTFSASTRMADVVQEIGILIEPYGDGSGLDAKTSEGMEHKLNLKESKQEQVEVDVGQTTRFRSVSPDESKEIKNINIDLLRKSFVVPNVVPRNVPDVKDSAKSGEETITFTKTKPGMLLKPAHTRRESTCKFDIDKFSDTTSKLDSAKDTKFQRNLGSQNEIKESCQDKHPIRNVTEKYFYLGLFDSELEAAREEFETGECETRDSYSDTLSDESECEKFWRWDGSSSKEGGMNNVEQDSHQLHFNDRLGHHYCQYLERLTPYGRVPLMDKLTEQKLTRKEGISFSCL